MVLQHVTDHAGLVVVAAAVAHRHFLRYGDLNVVHVVPVPEGLEDGVGETQDQQILYGLLAQVVVDTEKLLLLEHLLHHPVKLLGSRKVSPEGLFHNCSTPSRFGPGYAGRPQPPNCRLVKLGSRWFCSMSRTMGP